MRRNRFCLAVLGVVLAVLVCGMNIGSAWSYFTANASVEGALTIKVTPDTDITEEWDDGTKHVVITNNENSVPVFVRAKVYANPKYIDTIAGTNWVGPRDDGWVYYTEVVEPGSQTEELLVKIVFPVNPSTNLTNEEGGKALEGNATPEQRAALEAAAEEAANREGENFNVIVVYEATPAQYDADGNLLDPWDADWQLKAE